jgi:hypothetical protein
LFAARLALTSAYLLGGVAKLLNFPAAIAEVGRIRAGCLLPSRYWSNSAAQPSSCLALWFGSVPARWDV